MNRSGFIVASLIAAIALVVVGARSATSSVADAIVRLQSSSPGITQVGNANISGKMTAGQFAGNGSELTALNASALSSGLAAPAVGGIGIDTSAVVAGSMLYAAGTGEWGALLPGTDTQVLTLAGGLPTWANPTPLALPYSGTGTAASPNSLFRITNSGTGSAIWGETSDPSGYGIRGSSSATSGVTYGGHFEVNSPDGRGVFAQNLATEGPAIGGRFGTASRDGRAVWATAGSASPYGISYGVYAETLSPTGYGVYGVATADGAGGNQYAAYGVVGSSVSYYGAGVFGYADKAYPAAGVHGVDPAGFGVGVLGEAPSNTTTGQPIGVLGWTPSGTGYGVYCSGKFAATGTKSFQIDHPLDPENKLLNHYCQEGPEPQNVYDGIVTTDNKGRAWVELPDYFDSINRNPKIQLTVDDQSEDFVLVKAVGGVHDGGFLVRTNKPKVKVYWEVKAIRNDRFVRAYGAPTEVEKSETERGRYLQPELYGQPEEKRTRYGSPTPMQNPSISLKGR